MGLQVFTLCPNAKLRVPAILGLCPTQWLLSSQPQTRTSFRHLCIPPSRLLDLPCCLCTRKLAVFGVLSGQRSALSFLSIRYSRTQITQSNFPLLPGDGRSFGVPNCLAGSKLISFLQDASIGPWSTLPLASSISSEKRTPKVRTVLSLGQRISMFSSPEPRGSVGPHPPPTSHSPTPRSWTQYQPSRIPCPLA